MPKQSGELDFGRFPKPRRKTKPSDGSKALTDPRHEATAQYFATPKEMRDVHSVAELAQRIGVTRKTVYAWLKNSDVLLRCKWLTADIGALGCLAAKREWEEIVEALIDRAKAGNAKAARLVLHIAWPEDWPWRGCR
ncbi:MAG: hypothetical protein WAR24_24350 [Candidatus Acidiferrales bacterium]